MPKYRFTVEVDTVDELRAQLELLLRTADATIATRDGPTRAPSAPATGYCPAGHGPMSLIPAGTAKSGPRIGQAYPAFLKCRTCNARAELAP
jgi:hypothetical protein